MYGIALEGGGTKGSYQLGVWKAFKELGIEYNVVCGTSIGSMTGVFMAMNEYDKGEYIWENIKPSMLTNSNPDIIPKLSEFDIDKNDFNAIFQFMTKVVSDGGLDLTPFKEFLSKEVDEDKVRSSDIKFGLVTVNLTDMKPLELMIDDIPKGRLKDYLLASCSLPIFQKTYIDGKVYLDGGFHDNLPINLVASNGCKDIIAVSVGGTGIKQKPTDKNLNIIRITPSEDTGIVLDFSCDRAKTNIKMGYCDTMRVFRKLDGEYYYLENVLSEEDIINGLLKLTDEQILGLAKSLGVRKVSTKRMLFEDIIPKIAELLKIKKNKTYLDIFISLYEYCAKKLDIDRYNIYNIKEFFEIVENELLEFKNTKLPSKGSLKMSNPSLERVLRSTHLYKISKKDEVLMEVLFKFIIIRKQGELKE